MPEQMGLPWRESDEAPAPLRGPRRPPAVLFVRNRRARRYILRVLADATVRITIPRSGSRREAEAFLRTRLGWIAERQSELDAARVTQQWVHGTRVWWRGVSCPVLVCGAGDHVEVSCADICVVTGRAADYRAPLEQAMRQVAVDELPRELLALAARHDLVVQRVSIRNQRSRWGSCSRDGRIALNWRLMQMPEPVRAYVLLHELMHLHEPNHSPRFWAHVARVCPAYQEARAWLKREGVSLC
jgi:predicted metal-dependent hydrolase